MTLSFARLAATLLALAPCPLLAVEPVRCTASVQYDCSAQSCHRVTADLAHAEQFIFEPRSRTLTACLWTRCYSGTARVFYAADSADTTLIGQLVAEDENILLPPILVTLTVDDSREFVAVWKQTAQGLVFDQGVCNRTLPY